MSPYTPVNMLLPLMSAAESERYWQRKIEACEEDLRRLEERKKEFEACRDNGERAPMSYGDGSVLYYKPLPRFRSRYAGNY